MNLIEHAKNELKCAGLLNTNDEMQKEMNKHILQMVEEFSNEGHSGFSASYAYGILKNLLRFKPITPLTGEDDEWEECFDNTLQNKRMSCVFKDKKTGQAYNIEGNIFVDQNGSSFTNQYSSIPVTFPYMPEDPNIVKVFYRDNE